MSKHIVRNIHLLILLLLLPMSVVSRNIISPQVNNDSSVTFRYFSPSAQRVFIESDCLLKHEDNSWFGGKMRKKKMTKDDSGVWTLTTSPLTPEVYNYRIEEDGNKKEDPLNKDSIWILLHKESVVAVGGNKQADLYVERKDIPHGRIDTLDYFNEEQQKTRKVLVYVPPTRENEPLPVLYLLHGISGDETSWFECGRVSHILDNMLAEGSIRPMLVVMPDCNVPSKIDPKHRTNMFRNIFNYPALQKCDFEKAFPDLHNFISKKYNISDSRLKHAIAGLSSGSKQAANIVRDNPEIFATIGLFSPVVKKKQLPNYDNRHPSYYHIYVGKNDLFYNNGKHFCQELDSLGIPNHLYETSGGHTWQQWRIYLTELLFVLFPDEAN